MSINSVLYSEDFTPIPLPNENILFKADGVKLDIECGRDWMKRTCSKGQAYISNLRMFYISSNLKVGENAAMNSSSSQRNTAQDEFQSFSAHLTMLSDVLYKQPLFGANYLQAEVDPVPGGGLKSSPLLKLTFKSEGGYAFYNMTRELMDRMRETGEVPQHHELLPSYEHALGAPNVSVGRPPVVVSTNRTINPSHNNAGGNSTDVCGGEYAGTDLPPSYRP